MLKLVCILSLFGSIFASPLYEFNERIVNGTNAVEGEIPYIISLRYRKSHNCGGSILDAKHVLTAAHCVYGDDPNNLDIQYGQLRITNDATSAIAVESIVWHPNYAPGNGYANDVAVLKLKSAIPLGGNIRTVNLPPQSDPTPGQTNAVLAGWGYAYTGGGVMKDLQRVNITVYTDEDCERIHAQTGPTSREKHVCAGIPEGGKGQCSGDSGGPLVANGVQVGIVSWSVKPCTVKGYPGVFAKVSSYIDWIKQQTKS